MLTAVEIGFLAFCWVIVLPDKFVELFNWLEVRLSFLGSETLKPLLNCSVCVAGFWGFYFHALNSWFVWVLMAIHILGIWASRSRYFTFIVPTVMLLIAIVPFEPLMFIYHHMGAYDALLMFKTSCLAMAVTYFLSAVTTK